MKAKDYQGYNLRVIQKFSAVQPVQLIGHGNTTSEMANKNPIFQSERPKRTNYMKNILLLLVLPTLISCSKISGKYSKFDEGWLGTQNSLSTFDFDGFGGVTYKHSTSGSRSSNSFYSSNGSYKIEGETVILNFGGNDRVLKISDDNNILTDSDGNKYKKSNN